MRLLFLPIFLFSVMSFGQNESEKEEIIKPPPLPAQTVITECDENAKVVSARVVENMAIYPGCDIEKNFKQTKNHIERKQRLNSMLFKKTFRRFI